MKLNPYITILFFLFISPRLCYAEPQIVQISPKYCEQGEYEQPNGIFSIYVFCDDALGTNIAVFARDMHSPFLGKSNTYDLGKRFWQGEPWSYDVISFSWLNKEQLLLSTSGIYGSGSVYILNLYNKSSKVIYHADGAVVEIKEITDTDVVIDMEGPKGTTITKRIGLK